MELTGSETNYSDDVPSSPQLGSINPYRLVHHALSGDLHEKWRHPKLTSDEKPGQQIYGYVNTGKYIPVLICLVFEVWIKTCSFRLFYAQYYPTIRSQPVYISCMQN